MFGSPYYPAGVTDADIDRYFGNSCSCKTCYYFSNGVCSKKEDALTEEEETAMTDEEYAKAVSVDYDDYCDDYEYNDNLDVDDRW